VKTQMVFEVSLHPCVRCLAVKPFRQRAGENRCFCIIQCEACGFNVTGMSFEEAAKAWNGFQVWEMLFDLMMQLGEMRSERERKHRNVGQRV
jgi:hypothetical protein